MNPRIIRMIMAVLLVPVAIMATAQASGSLQFNRLSHIDGMLHDNVTSIAQDSLGFMWFGTHRGLNRFDGYRIDSWKYSGDEINSVFYDRIYSIAREGERLWLATEAGLSCFDTFSKEYKDFAYPDNNGDDFYRNIRYVCTDPHQGYVWLLAGQTFRLAKVTCGPDGKSIDLRHIKIGNSNCYESDGANPRVASDRDGRVWFSGCPTIEAYREDNGGNLMYVGHVPGVNGYNVKAMLRDNGSLWIAYPDKILHCEVLGDGMLIPVQEIAIPTSVGVNSIAASPQYIWVTAQDGAFCLPKDDPTKFTAYRQSSYDSRSVIRDINSVMVDNLGNVWLSGWESGVAFANPMSGMFGTLRFPSVSAGSENGTFEFVSALHADDDGYIYVGSKFGGLGRINYATKEIDRNFSRDAALMRNNITSVESDDRFVYAANDNTVYIVDKSTGKSIGSIHTKANGYIFWIAFDKFRRMWLATYAGLECFRQLSPDKWENVYSFRVSSPSPYTLTTDMLHNICSDKDKNELIVTSAMGINRVILDDKGDVERIINYTASSNGSDNRLSSNYLWPIAKANDSSSYWIGSMGNGLNKVTFDDSEPSQPQYTAAHYGFDAGAINGDVESLQIDRFGRVWCAGTYLGYFDENVLRFNYYDISDGLQGSLFGTSSATTDKNGALWFGGANGINYFIPARESSAPVRTGVVLSTINASGKPVGETGDAITLTYPDNNFTVDFSTLSYTTSNHVRYRYRLDGYDQDWHYIEPGQMPAATYSRLPYRKMKLIVEAGDWQDWSGAPAELTVNSCGPWWSSWWAISIYIILGLLVIAGIIYYFISWTRMKQAIAIRRDKEEHQQEMMQMKMKFFTDVSHEFRTPLTLIRHAAGELQRDTADNERYVRLIARNAGVLTNMVNELLDFHRADMKSTPLRTTLTSVTPMITAIVEEFKGWAEGSDISINLEFKERDLEMWLDREQLSKIISNIISNSIRYTDGGGRIDISVSTGLYQDVKTAFTDRVSLVSDMIPGKQLIIKIKDTGIGIKPELLPVIFERFRQTHGQVRTANGSGIGLSLVKYLIELHHGGITVSSAEDEGTEVIIFIPMTYDYLRPDQKVGESVFDMKEYLKVYGAEYETIRRRTAETAEAELTDDRPLIMVVDDNKEILDLLYDFFSGDYDVVIAESAEEALEKASQKLPDLIISDIMMPGIDGIEFCSRLKTNMHTCHIPVILLTAMAHEENQIEGIEVGADAYVAKPFNPRLLTATVKNLINRNRRENTGVEKAAAGDDTVVSVRQEIKDRKEHELFAKFEALVRENFTNYDYTVEDIWKGLGLNRTRLYNMVKETSGMSLGNYIKKLRLEYAAELLLTTDLSIAEIAYKVGIESHAYFTRSFRQQYNMSPTEWIKAHQKNDEK